jgi:hypothetical protein
MRVEAVEGDGRVLDSLDLELLGQLHELSISDSRARLMRALTARAARGVGTLPAPDAERSPKDESRPGDV